MDNQTTNTILASNNYDQFVLLDQNRKISRPHVEKVKKALEENGNFLASNPILVNERMEVIDGQHRLEACKELELMVFYVVSPGLTVDDSRNMNVLQRNWNTQDYIESYAAAGKQPYLDLLQLIEEYPGIARTTLVIYYLGRKKNGHVKDIHTGELEQNDIDAARERLNKLEELATWAPGFRQTNMAGAFLTILNTEGFDYNRMVEKVQQLGSTIKPYIGITENTRQLENVYNYGRQQANYLRFF